MSVKFYLRSGRTFHIDPLRDTCGICHRSLAAIIENI